jgi:hypothetical protein
MPPQESVVSRGSFFPPPLAQWIECCNAPEQFNVHWFSAAKASIQTRIMLREYYAHVTNGIN